MFDVSGYQITEQLHESANSWIYRAHRLVDKQPVVLKILKQDYPPPEKIAWFKREYETTHNLNDIKGVVAVYDLESDQNRFFIILEDFGATSVDRLKLAGQMPLTDFLTLAISVTDILGQLHQRYLIHKDINPSNIILNTTTKQLKLIDFGISTVLSRENATFSNPNLLEGTLAYLSPEQTGRMNRAIDYRTDFYSLGVTFYELLTGQLPFPMPDALEVVHCHIARQPVPPHSLKSEVPQAISEIVLKLMAKNAEDRYQSTYGLKADLEDCLQQWQTAGQIEAFPLARADVSDRFEIPQKLYGREAKIATLMAGAERVSQGTSEMMLVAGYSGIGKSALVQEVYKPLTRQRGYFIAGKFDPFQRDIPYASLIQAFRALMRQLLTESAAALATWCKKLQQALGSNGQVIIELIPEVEQVIGPQPAVPELPPAEAQNRINLVFQNFIKVFTQPEHPLVMFLDDLQWTDGASLKLIELLMTAPDSHYLFLIGAYRDNEVNEAHPLMLTLDEIKKANTTVNQITLSPLTLPHITQLITDIIQGDPDIAFPLAELVHAKTSGNPFFVIEFLKLLYAEVLLTFNYKQGRWQWDLEQIVGQQITDNVVELMATKVQKLLPETLVVLKLAAVIGNQFYLETLAIVSEKSPRDTAAALWAAISDGFILPLSDTYKLMELEVEGLSEQAAFYKFAHDRIQQAVYSLIPDKEKPLVHLRVGQLLHKNTPTEKLEQKLFDIVNHLNQGQTLIKESSELDELALLNLRAGRKAKASAAYQPALNYLQVGLSLLEEDSWHQQYDLTMRLYEESAEAAYLSGQFEKMELLTEVVLQKARFSRDKVKAYEVKIHAYYAQLKFMEAIKIGSQVLQLLGEEFYEHPTQSDIMQALQETQTLLAGKRPEDLINLPEMTVPAKLAIMSIITKLYLPAFVGGMNELIPLLVSKQINLTIKHGKAVESAYAYAMYGIILCGGGDIDTGYRFGRLALRAVESFNAKELQAKSYMMVSFYIIHWKEHIRDILPNFLKAYQSGLSTGDLEFASNAVFTYSVTSYLVGNELRRLGREMAKYEEVIARFKQEAFLHGHDIYWQALQNLLIKTENPCNLIGEVYNEEKILPRMLEANEIGPLFVLYFNKMILSCLFQYFQQAIKNANTAEEYFSPQIATTLLSPVYHFYDSLIRLAVFLESPEDEQQRILEKVAANQEKMETWAKHGPMNCLHKFHLVEAERARVLGNYGDAREYYDKAIAGAHENEYLNEEALAYELAGRFYLTRGQNHFADYYLKNAHYAYQRWGAVAKVRDLEARYPHLLSQPISTSSNDRLSNTTITGTHSGEALDLAAVMKASQAISGEMVLDKLLSNLMNVVIENAGAQKGFLILKNAEGDWVIEAEGGVDSEAVTTRQSFPIDSEEPLLSAAIVNYVARTQESVVLNDALNEGEFTAEAYIVAHQPKSLLCTPLLNQGQLSGILYLENNLTTGAFTADRLEVLQLLSSQAAISIDNAKLYTEMAELNNELKEMDRLKDDFLANTSHELRTPLNGIIGITQSLLEGAGGPLTDEQIANLQMVVSSGKRLDTLVNYILDFSKLKRQEIELQRKPVDFRQLTQLVLTLSGPLIGGKPISLQNEIAEDLPPVYGDENRLQQIMHNLIGNAIKFTATGSVTVKADVTEDNRIEITVADTGIGIPKDKFDTIFKSFEQVDASTAREYGGTGLGLSITKQLVELHGGTISVASELGQGAQFTFTLSKSSESPAPLTEIQEAITKVRDDEISRHATPQPLVAEGGYTILAVDDEPVNLQVVANLLSIENYAVKTVMGGAETLALLEQGEKPDLILLDIMMPKMTGYEVCQKLREQYSATELPIMLLTAKNQVSDLVEGLNVGANDYITKPVSKNELLARIKTHINLSRLKTENIRLNAELDVARRLQQMLLPKEHELTQVAGLEIAGFMEPAEKVGGDYYDVLVSNGRIKLAIGDTTGHGLESGILAIMVQTAVRTLLENGETDPVKFLTTINRTLYDNVERMRVSKSMTLSLLEYVDGGKLKLSGQHEDIIWIRNGELELIDTFDLGFPIGLEQDITDFVSEKEISLNPGDVVVFYTDGITEAENMEKELYGMERLCEVVQQNWQRTVNEIKQAVIDDVGHYIGKQQVFDDITLLVLKQQ
ncbi:MAG TPA: response regulator [Thiotrichaceae bacterium]|nr:response regulator [Thiotrichaceae bacterium]